MRLTFRRQRVASIVMIVAGGLAFAWSAAQVVNAHAAADEVMRSHVGCDGLPVPAIYPNIVGPCTGDRVRVIDKHVAGGADSTRYLLVLESSAGRTDTVSLPPALLIGQGWDTLALGDVVPVDRYSTPGNRFNGYITSVTIGYDSWRNDHSPLRAEPVLYAMMVLGCLPVIIGLARMRLHL